EGSRTSGTRIRALLGGGISRLVRIPPGVAHGCRNLGSSAARILYLTDLHFSPEPDRTDEGRLPWDLFGADVWELAREGRAPSQASGSLLPACRRTRSSSPQSWPSWARSSRFRSSRPIMGRRPPWAGCAGRATRGRAAATS